MKKIIFMLNIIMLLCIGVHAETISLEQARIMALANSRSIAKYNMALESSALDEKSQLYSMLPQVSAGYSASMSYLDGNKSAENFPGLFKAEDGAAKNVFVNPLDTFTAGLSLSVTQKIFEGGKSFIRKSLGEISTEGVRKQALAEYFNVLDAADNAYYAVLEAAAGVESAESSLQTADYALSMAEIRRTSGMINQGDYLKALADKEMRDNSLRQARRNLSLCTAQLKTLVGAEAEIELQHIDFNRYENLLIILAEIEDGKAQTLFDIFWKELVQSNPSLAAAALNNQRAEKNVTLSKRDYAPTLSATVFSTGLNYYADSGFSGTLRGGLQLSGNIPLDFWVINNNIKKNEIARDSAALDYAGTENSLVTSLQTALLDAFSQAGTVLSSRRSLEYADKHFEYVMELYRLSQNSVSELGDASSLLISARNSLVSSQYGFLQSLSKLRSLCAIDDEEKLLSLLEDN